VHRTRFIGIYLGFVYVAYREFGYIVFILDESHLEEIEIYFQFHCVSLPTDRDVLPQLHVTFRESLQMELSDGHALSEGL